ECEAQSVQRTDERKGVRRNDAYIAAKVDEALLVKSLRIHDRGVDVGEDLELVRAAYVVAVARGAVGDDPVAVHLAHLPRLEGLDHALLARHAPDPVVGLDAHSDSRLCRRNPRAPRRSQVSSTTIFGNPPLRSRARRASAAAVRRAISKYGRARGASGAATSVGVP